MGGRGRGFIPGESSVAPGPSPVCQVFVLFLPVREAERGSTPSTQGRLGGRRGRRGGGGTGGRRPVPHDVSRPRGRPGGREGGRGAGEKEIEPHRQGRCGVGEDVATKYTNQHKCEGQAEGIGRFPGFPPKICFSFYRPCVLGPSPPVQLLCNHDTYQSSGRPRKVVAPTASNRRQSDSLSP